MQSVIAKLLEDFEHGKMNGGSSSRVEPRGVAAAGVAPGPGRGKPLEASTSTHSYSVNDYKKVRDFYVDLLGMKITEDDGKQCDWCSQQHTYSRNRADGGPAKWTTSPTPLRTGGGEDGIEAELKRRNLQYTGAPRPASRSRTRRGWSTVRRIASMIRWA